MDENIVNQILQEDIPDWDSDESKDIDGYKQNEASDNASEYTEEEDEDACSKVNSQQGTLTTSTVNDVMSVSSLPDATVLSPRVSRRQPSQQSIVLSHNGDIQHVQQHQTGRIIKHAVLTKVSNQLNTSRNRINTGNPTCCARAHFLAIGTSKGLTFLFDLKQVLRCFIGNQDDSGKFGAVSSLSFNMDSTRLLVGFVKAHINMWDITGVEGKLLRSINVNQGPGYAVSFVRFLPDPTMAVYADTSGSVFQLMFKRGISGRSTDSDCFFSGCRGEILCLEPLFLPKRMSKSIISDHCLLAMASFTKLIVVSCKPHLKVNYMYSLKGDAQTLPQLAWCFAPEPNDSNGDSVGDILLAFARDHNIYILRVKCTNDSRSFDISSENQTSDLKFDMIFQLVLEFQILSLKWMNPHFLGVLDFGERLHALDFRTKAIVESLDLKSSQMVYNTSLFKSTATGGNVSEAMTVAAEKACYHSVVEQSGQIKILGLQDVHLLMLRPWIEAVEFSLENQGPEHAFRICSELYTGDNITSRRVLMLPLKGEERQKVVTKKSLNLIEQVLSTPIQVSDYHSFFNAILDLCKTIKHISFFTDTVYNLVQKNGPMEIAFIRSTIPLILNNVVRTLHPELVQRIVEYLSSTDQMMQLDCTITKLDITCLDLDSIIKLATKRHLFSSLIHIHNNAFLDYLTPLTMIVEFIVGPDFSQTDSEIQSETVIKSIVYTHCCLAGKNYFTSQEIPLPICDRVKGEVFEYFIPFNKSSNSLPLYTLLHHNTNEFLNMLTLVFDEDFFTSDIGISRKQAILKRICDYFTQNKFDISKEDIIRFFVFLSRELTKSNNIAIYIEQCILDQLIEKVCLALSEVIKEQETNRSSSLIMLHKQAEMAMFNFLLNHSNYRDYWMNNDRILNLAWKAHLSKVCMYIYRQKNMLHMVLECYKMEDDLSSGGINFIDSVWNDPSINDSQRSQVVDKCFDLAEHFVLASPILSIIILVTVCKRRLEEVVNKLCSANTKNQVTFSFLKAFFFIRNEVKDIEQELSNIEVSPMISTEIKATKVPCEIAELFVDYLCTFDKENLITFLKYSVDYRSTEAIKIVSKHDLPFCLGFLYEKTKKFDKACSLYVDVINIYWENWTKSQAMRNEDLAEFSKIGKNFQQCIDSFISLVEKHKAVSLNFDSLAKAMLDTILNKCVQCKSEIEKSKINAILTYFVKSLSTVFSLPVILSRIFQNPLFTQENYGTIKELYLFMVTSYNNEKLLLESCVSLKESDSVHFINHFLSDVNRSIIVSEPKCSRCDKLLSIIDGAYNFVSFRCGHWFHRSCLLDSKLLAPKTKTNSDETLELFCVICQSHAPIFRKENVEVFKESKLENSKQYKKIQQNPPDCPTKNIQSKLDLMFPDVFEILVPKSENRSVTTTASPNKLKLSPPNYLKNFCKLSD